MDERKILPARQRGHSWQKIPLSAETLLRVGIGVSDDLTITVDNVTTVNGLGADTVEESALCH